MQIHFVLHIHKQLFTVYHIHFMRTVIDEYPKIYLDELQEWMQHLTGKVIAISTIHKYLKKIGLSVQKVFHFTIILFQSLFLSHRKTDDV